MRNITSCICIMGLSGVAFGGILLDQVGPLDGTGIGIAIMGCQDFETAFDIYDIVAADNFTAVGGENIGTVEMVLNGWNGFLDPSSVTGYSANLYSGGIAASTSLVGDIASQAVAVINVTNEPLWLGGGFLQSVPTAMTAVAGVQFVGIIPSNDFGISGQTGLADSLLGDPIVDAFQANPGGGFAMPGNWQVASGEGAYRVTTGVPADPCLSPLPQPCPADVNGDGQISVGDVLDIIGSWGQCGDGTFRPTGDVAPLPNGDCCVTVADVLAVVGAWGADCAIYGGCCLDDGTCSVVTAADCALAGGTYFGDNTDCTAGLCVAGACCLDLVNCVDVTDAACAALAGTYKGDGTLCATTDCSIVVAGDECADAVVAIDGANPFETLTMTPTLPVPTCAAPGFGWTTPVNDFWFVWTAGATSDYDIDTCDPASYDTSFVIYSGPCNALVQVACDGDGGPNGAPCGPWSSALVFAATAGNTYYIRIGGWDGAGTGTLNINEIIPLPGACCFPDQSCLDNLDSVSCVAFGGVFAGNGTTCAQGVCLAPAGDECIDAIVAVLGPNAFDTTLMTSSVELVDEAMCAGTFLNWGTVNPDAWLVWTATATGTATFSACDPLGTDTSMVLYSGSCAALVQEACNGDTTGQTGCQAFYSSIVDHPVTAGVNYYIRMGSYLGTNSGPGTVTITMNDPNALAACCVAGVCTEVTTADCALAGGSWNPGLLCIDVTCYAGCPTGADLEGELCFLDGDDSTTDINCGINCIPPLYGAIQVGVPLCGNASVFLDITGGQFRDTDWYKNTTLDLGGNFTVTVQTAGDGLLFGFVDNVAGAFVANAVSVGGGGTVSVVGLLPGDYSVWCGNSSWDVAWTCASGLAEYTVTLTSP